MKLALAIALGNGVGRAEIDHVECARRAHIGHAGPDYCTEAIVGRRKHAAHHQIAHLGRGKIDHGSHLSGLDQFFHRAAAHTGGVEDQTLELLAKIGCNLLYGGSGHAEHGDADGWKGDA